MSFSQINTADIKCVTKQDVSSVLEVSLIILDSKLKAVAQLVSDSASNRNEYQEYFLGGKGGR